jgi:hypothetical protein
VGADFSEQYVRALENRADWFFEQLIEITKEKCETQVDVSRQRNRIEVLKWAAGRMAPKKYGDRVQVDSKALAFQPAVLIQIGAAGEREPKTIEHDDG